MGGWEAITSCSATAVCSGWVEKFGGGGGGGEGEFSYNKTCSVFAGKVDAVGGISFLAGKSVVCCGKEACVIWDFICEGNVADCWVAGRGTFARVGPVRGSVVELAALGMGEWASLRAGFGPSETGCMTHQWERKR